MTPLEQVKRDIAQGRAVSEAVYGAAMYAQCAEEGKIPRGPADVDDNAKRTAAREARAMKVHAALRGLETAAEIAGRCGLTPKQVAASMRVLVLRGLASKRKMDNEKWVYQRTEPAE